MVCYCYPFATQKVRMRILLLALKKCKLVQLMCILNSMTIVLERDKTQITQLERQRLVGNSE